MPADVIGFEFPKDNSGQWDGFNVPGIEHFSGNPFEHLGREVPQNTIDAISSPAEPARINVKLLKIATSDIPDVVELRAAVQRCFKAADSESEKAKAFFSNALKVLDDRKVTVLQISDYNTTGMAGPCENGKPFFAMMKATGQSKKSDAATGSFGIGKFAPFTVSALRTVFVTTVWKDEGGKYHHYVQGKSILMSHPGLRGVTHRGTGFWGIKQNCQPVSELSKVPKWLRRAPSKAALEGHVGTTLSILGFSAKGDWEKTLAANIAGNFFGAIHEGKLEVYIDGGPTITRDLLPSLLTDSGLATAVSEQKGEPEKLNNVRSYYRALAEGAEVVTVETENQHLGKCQLKVLIGEKLPKRVAVLRNGMLITDELTGLKRFGPFKEFVAVLECRAEKGLALLRAMEPPRHDDFEADRLPPDKRQAGRIALREIVGWVREMLSRHAKDPITEVTTLDELADYFGDEDEAGASRRRDENPGGTIIIRQRPVKAKSRAFARPATQGTPLNDVDEEGGGDGFGETGVPGGPSQSYQYPEGTERPPDGCRDDPAVPGDSRQASEARPAIDTSPANLKRSASSGTPLQNVRAVPIALGRRKIAFTPAISGIISVELQDSGADTNYRLNVLSTTVGKLQKGIIEGVPVTAGERCVFEVELDNAFSGTLRVVANAV